MKSSCWMHMFPVGLLCACFVVGGAQRSASAEEPAQDFLEALRKQHYFDTAIDYLEQLKSSPVAPAKMREVIGYERGVTLVDGASHQRDFGLREKQLDEAQSALEEFVAQQPNHNLTFSANSQLGNLVAERARLKIERIKRPAEPNKDKLRTEAKELFAKAHAVFVGLTEVLKTRLESFPKLLDEKKDARQWELREQLRSEYLITQLTAVAVLEDSADAFDKSSPEYKATLEKAGKEYGALYEKYRTKVGALYARLYQGRTAQKTGNLKDALSYYKELLDQPDEPQAFHVIKTKALLLAIDCWMADSQKKYAEIANRGSAWIEKAYGAEVRSDEFMALRLHVARASRLYADQLRKEKPKDPQVNGLLIEARKLTQYVARFPGDHQKEAQKLLAELGVGGTQAAGSAQPKTFADARAAGKESLETYQVYKLNLDTLPTQIKSEQEAAVKLELEAKLAESQEGVKTSLGESLQYFQLAMRLADRATDDEDLNLVRYYLSILNFFQNEYLDAAVIGTFVAQRFPDSGAARPCAKIAMSAYIQLFNGTKTAAKKSIESLLAELDQDHDGRISVEELQAAPEPTQALLAGADVDHDGKLSQSELLRILTRFEADHIVEVASYITNRWPDQPEAQEALGTLIAFMIGENQLEKAQAHLDKIPVDSSQRGSAELKMGEALWKAYTKGMAEVRDQEQAVVATGSVPDAATAARLATRKQELVDLKNRAQKTLVDGVARMEQTGRIDVNFAQAVLSLAQIFVDTEQAAKAVELLERENAGPLALVKTKHETAQRSSYIEETYRIALRAYISSLADAAPQQADALIQKAEGIMDGLKESVGATEDGQKRLTNIYLALAREIEQQMKLASADAKKNLSKGFETFLDRVGAETKDLNILVWVAQTYFSMGDSFATQKGGGASPDAKRFFGKAAKTYQELLDRGTKQQIVLEPQIRGQITQRLAMTKRAMEDYEGAIALFKQILTDNNRLLTVQVEAAKTYEQWAERSGEPKHYLNALGGSMESKTKKSTIWGWIELAKIANQAKIRDAYYDARYHVSLARFKYGLAQKDATKRAEHLKTAEQSLTQTYRFFPALDGDPAENHKSFREPYDSLAKAIQKALKKKESGLAAYALEASPGGAPATGAPATGAPATGAPATGAGTPIKSTIAPPKSVPAPTTKTPAKSPQK